MRIRLRPSGIQIRVVWWKVSEVTDVSVILCPSAQRHKPEDLNLLKPGSQNLSSRKADLTGTACSIFVPASSHVLKLTRLSLLYAISWPLTSFCSVTYKRQTVSHKADLTSSLKMVSCGYKGRSLGKKRPNCCSWAVNVTKRRSVCSLRLLDRLLNTNNVINQSFPLKPSEALRLSLRLDGLAHILWLIWRCHHETWFNI